jgi:hypothetical protein
MKASPALLLFDIQLSKTGTLNSVFIVPDWQQDFQPLYRHGSGKNCPVSHDDWNYGLAGQ